MSIPRNQILVVYVPYIRYAIALSKHHSFKASKVLNIYPTLVPTCKWHIDLYYPVPMKEIIEKSYNREYQAVWFVMVFGWNEISVGKYHVSYH